MSSTPTTKKTTKKDCMASDGACQVMVIAVGNGHSDTSSNPGQDVSHSSYTLGKDMNPVLLWYG